MEIYHCPICVNVLSQGHRRHHRRMRWTNAIGIAVSFEAPLLPEAAPKHRCNTLSAGCVAGGDLVGEAVKLVGEGKCNNHFCGSHKFIKQSLVPQGLDKVIN